MPHDPVLHMLGLARKAGKLELGEEPVGPYAAPITPACSCWRWTPPPTPTAGPSTSLRPAMC